jgi:hypothetical protein
MVSQRARDRGKRHKAEVASRLTQKSNPELIAAFVYVMRNFKPGEWTPPEAVNTRFKSLNLRMRDALRCARWVLNIHANRAKGYWMRRHPEIELEKFGLRWAPWWEMNPDLFCDKTIFAFECEHRDLWRMVKSYLLGEALSPIDGCFTPWKQPAPMDFLGREASDPIAAGFQAEIRDQLGLNDFVAGVHAAAAVGCKPGPSKNVVREVNGQRFLKPL